MYIRCWGSRGSVPVSGREYEKYGGDTTCIEIRPQSGEPVIIDAGTGIRRLGAKLLKEKHRRFHLIFTHSHWDHIMGFPFFKPLYNEKNHIIMYRCPISRFVKTMLSDVMTPPYFPVRYSDLFAEISYAEDNVCSNDFTIGSVNVESIRLSHPNTGRGYKFIENGRSFVFLTDNELDYDHPGRASYESYVEFASGADVMFHDAEYTPDEYPNVVSWGHSTYVQAVDLAIEAGVKRLGLFHINQDRNDRAMDEMVDRSREIIRQKGSSLDCFAVAADMDFDL